MLFFKKLLQLLFLLHFIFSPSISQEISRNHCGKIILQPPFWNPNASNSSVLRHMIRCKSDILYFRTSIGLFRVSSIDYTNKLLIVSHNLRSSVSEFVSPRHLSAGFPSLSTPNSLILFNCSNHHSTSTLFKPCNNSQFSGCYGSSAKNLGCSSCSVIDDVWKLEKSFHPKEMNCTHYSRVYKSNEKYEIGTRISFDVPDHVPNPCDECKKPDGNCGVGLRCVCHPKLCKDRVISGGTVAKPSGNILIHLISFFVLMNSFQRYGVLSL